MNAKPAKELIDKFQLQICEDRSFEKSPRNVRLLKFLIDKAITETDVNEYIVGLELFEKNYKPENNDSKVRVYMFNLRKKLEEYYNNAGKNDELKFVLNKGQYNLEFEIHENRENETSTEKTNIHHKKHKIWQTVEIALALVLVLFISYFILNKNNNNTFCWEPFFTKNANNICITADQTICYKMINGEKVATIIFGINSENDFIDYLNTNTKDTVLLADYTLFSKMAHYSVKRLTEWFVGHGSNFSLRSESRFRTDELRDNNILYVGQFKTMNASEALFLKDSKVFGVRSTVNGFIVRKDGHETKYIAHSQKDVRTEYAMVSFVKLESGKNALFFVSNNDIGVMATVNNFTNKEWLTNFYKNLPANTKYFNALFEVSGLQRTEIDSKLVELELVE